MIIIIIDENTLQLTFTTDELTSSLFKSTLNKMYNSDDYDTHKHGDDVNVDLGEESTYNIIGQSVDDIRQMWCGDVSPDSDLTGCPCFIIGLTDESIIPPDSTEFSET
jgi:hypothetical protein